MKATASFDLRGLAQGRVQGIVLAFVLALAASWMAGGLGDPIARNPVLVAMLLGLVLGNAFGCPESFRPGLDFTKRQLLRLAVMLLGFRATIAVLADLGPVPIGIAAAELVIVLLAVHWAAIRIFRLEPEQALLVACGAAICGAAAVLSVAAVTRAREREAGLAITLITVAGTLALLAYPIAFLQGWMPGLDERSFGVVVGASIFELAQVYGASYAVAEGALNTATLVKLSKVVMLIPLLAVIGLMRRRAQPAQVRAPLAVPWFVVGFIAVLALNSLVTIHPVARQLILEADQFMFLMVMVALGMSTRLELLREPAMAMRFVGTGLFALLLSATVAWSLVALAMPAPASQESTAAGARLFTAVGCDKCHVPSLRGERGDVTLYSDLLLHDMGPALDDKIIQGDANGFDWRTTPLAGLGARQRFLHDGRALTLRDAILAHGGESEIVRRRYFELSDADQRQVLAFLESL
jgi:uncharacterized integral membrane protein (TIGR00698 family)